MSKKEQDVGFIPNEKHILVRVLQEVEETTESGLYKPQTAIEQPSEADVVAVGPDCGRFAVGNRVLFKKYAGTEVKVRGEKLLILQPEDVLGWMTE